MYLFIYFLFCFELFIRTATPKVSFDRGNRQCSRLNGTSGYDFLTAILARIHARGLHLARFEMFEANYIIRDNFIYLKNIYIYLFFI